MSEQPWMPLYVADYLRDTDNLNMEESGCYLHLLMAMWARDGTIPDDDKDNARRLRLRVDRWRRIKARLMPFLQNAPEGFLTQKRLHNEWLAAQIRIKKWRDNGAKGGRKSAEINDLAKATLPLLVQHRARVRTTTTTVQKENGKDRSGEKSCEQASEYSDQEIAGLQLEFDTVDVSLELEALVSWADGKGIKKPNERKIAIYGALKRKHELRAEAKSLVAARENPPTISVSSNLANSKLAKAKR